MSDQIFETSDVKTSVDIILRQTNYTEDEANQKLKQFNFNKIAVIKEYLGITEKKALPINSVNQEIYKQMRNKLNSDMCDFIKRKNNSETKLK